jgi:3-oxoacyl-[acyl-carrier-protein] synthase II
MGTVNPLGCDVESFWQAIKEGRSGITVNDRFDTRDYATKIAGLVKNFKASDFMDSKEARKMALFTQYAVAASVQAMNQAQLNPGAYDPDRIGVIIGNGIGGFEVIEDSLYKIFTSGPSRVPPMSIPKLISNEGPANVAIKFNCQGPCATVTTACASGADALGMAALLIKAGRADVVISGGTEAAVTFLGIAGFNVIQALSTRYNDRPAQASRPFDKNRDGFVNAEGAGILVLESLEHAARRGAFILGEFAGYGSTCDANHLTAPHPEGLGAVKAMKEALKEAGLRPEDVDYINAHGTSTPINDPIETQAIKKALGDHARRVKISSTKSMTGHTIGAAGGVESIVSLLAIRDNFFPPTINLEEPDPECDLDYVPNRGQEGKIDVVMSNSLGFGGHNGVVIFKRFVS